MKNAKKQYIRAVADALTCTGKEKRKVLSYLQDRIAESIPDGADSSLQMLEEQFGTPEAVAESIAEQVETLPNEKRRKKRKRVILMVVLLLAVVLTIVAGVILWRMPDVERRGVKPDYYIVESPPIYHSPTEKPDDLGTVQE